MTDTPGAGWPFAPALRFSALGLLAVVISTFIDGWASVGLLVGAAAMTATAVVSFVRALRMGRDVAAEHRSPDKVQHSAREPV
jgi:hypothetical protein